MKKKKEIVVLSFFPTFLNNFKDKMNTLAEAIEYYKSDSSKDKHKVLYQTFEKNASENHYLKKQYSIVSGFGELAFSWNWFLLVQSMPDSFDFLEIGVYKGRIISLVQMIANLLNKSVNIYAITPLNNTGDKFSEYDNLDYLKEIQRSYSLSNVSMDTTTLIKGFSQDHLVIDKAQKRMYNIIFIDGSHDYANVILDIKNYTPFIKPGGYLVMDDASFFLENAYGVFLGHCDVSLAIEDVLESNIEFEHVLAIGHNRVWKKRSISGTE